MAMTPNMQVVYDYVKAEYGLSIGVTNCRRISGSQTWSQHASSNANDYFTSSHSLQDAIAADLRDRFGDDIRNILTWRYNAAHWNHVHVDMWPRGWLTPPCAGGQLRIKYKDGHITYGKPFPLTIKEEDMAILSDKEQVELQKFLGFIKAANSNVGFVTQSIQDVRERNARGMPAKEKHTHPELSEGAKGDKGDKGNTGAAGPTGPKGSTGSTGAKGSTGTTGIRGISGADGELTIRGTKEI